MDCNVFGETKTIKNKTSWYADYEGYFLDSRDFAVAAVDGAVARGRLQRRLRRTLCRISQEVGVCLKGHFGKVDY